LNQTCAGWFAQRGTPQVNLSLSRSRGIPIKVSLGE
jgi:hypothetical protein